MKLYFSGHRDQYAAEQTLMTLFPGERPEYSEDPPGGDNELELTLHTGKTFFSATALLRRDGRSYRRQCRAKHPPEGSSPLVLDRVRRRTLQRAFYLAATDHLGKEPPWGMLTGVRPVKLPTRWVLGGMSWPKAERELLRTYRLSESRARLAIDCARASIDMMEHLAPNEISLYVGIPFCPTRCTYCSFISAAGHNNTLIAPYLEGLLKEVEAAGEAVGRQGLSIRSVYIGGGTPTTLSASDLARLMAAVQASFSLQPGIEYTVEAGRPDTITREKLLAIKAGGGNRISVNPQSMSDEVLRAMGRAHSAADILTAWDLVQAVGFDSVNMDLIAGLPQDSVKGFQKSLGTLLDLGPENITVHTLALKKGSTLRGEAKTLPDGAAVAQMLDFAWQRLRENAYLPYYLYRQKFMSGSFENVGWCKEGFESAYNICMMEELHTVLSLGAGGVTKYIDYSQGAVKRLSNPKYPQEYLRDLPHKIEEKRRFAPRQEP